MPSKFDFNSSQNIFSCSFNFLFRIVIYAYTSRVPNKTLNKYFIRLKL
jgi:hypothetical protein